MKRILTKKNKGLGDLICSLFVIMALTIVLFLSVYVTQDISKVTEIDQIARQCIIELETSGNLDCRSIQQQLEAKGYIFSSSDTGDDGVFILYGNNLGNKSNTKLPTAVSYGTKVAVEIKCKVPTTSFGGNIFGTENNNNNLSKQTYTQVDKIKASISKTEY